MNDKERDWRFKREGIGIGSGWQGTGKVDKGGNIGCIGCSLRCVACNF